LPFTAKLNHLCSLGAGEQLIRHSTDPLLAADRDAKQARTLVIVKTKAMLSVLPAGRISHRRLFVDLLRSRPNHFIPKDEIIEYIWGLEDGGPLAAAHTLDVYSCLARRDGLIIEVAKGVGIRLVLKGTESPDRLAVASSQLPVKAAAAPQNSSSDLR
jgi:hypothetical protein